MALASFPTSPHRHGNKYVAFTSRLALHYTVLKTPKVESVIFFRSSQAQPQNSQTYYSNPWRHSTSFVGPNSKGLIGQGVNY
jgi:hypothetical protein